VCANAYVGHPSSHDDDVHQRTPSYRANAHAHVHVGSVLAWRGRESVPRKRLTLISVMILIGVVMIVVMVQRLGVFSRSFVVGVREALEQVNENGIGREMKARTDSNEGGPHRTLKYLDRRGES
jgi:hypothetical protein